MTDELVKVTMDNKVSGRELHEFLEVKTPYDKWMSRMIDYGFAEEDFLVTDKNVHNSNGGKQTVV